MPSFKGFKGTVEELGDSRYVVSGEVAILDDSTIEITELPVRSWTQNYKEEVLEPMLQGTDKTQPLIQCVISHKHFCSLLFLLNLVFFLSF